MQPGSCCSAQLPMRPPGAWHKTRAHAAQPSGWRKALTRREQQRSHYKGAGMPQHDARGLPSTWGARRRQSQHPRRRGRASLPHAAALFPASPRSRQRHSGRGLRELGGRNRLAQQATRSCLALSWRVFVSEALQGSASASWRATPALTTTIAVRRVHHVVDQQVNRERAHGAARRMMRARSLESLMQWRVLTQLRHTQESTQQQDAHLHCCATSLEARPERLCFILQELVRYREALGTKLCKQRHQVERSPCTQPPRPRPGTRRLQSGASLPC